MIKKGIMISWDNAREFIEIDLDNPESFSSISSTKEAWESGGRDSVVYQVPTPKVEKKGDTYEIRIQYQENLNFELSNTDAQWGVSTITITKGATKGKAEWKGYDDSSMNGVCEWQRLDIPLRGERRKITTTRLQREQAKLRDDLLVIDQSCVLTGETTKSTLEAAHVIPVSDRGRDSVSNAILLRSDIHRLYDSGAFEIQPSGELKITSNSLSVEYVKLLNSVCLSSDTLNRIDGALSSKSC